MTDTDGKPVLDEKGQPKTEKSPSSPSRCIAVGPAASQIAIKQLGTNGGGFFNVNSAHPFENPTPLSNFLEMLSILLISAALCYTFGKMVGDTRQGWAVLAAMTVIFVGLLAVCVVGRADRPPARAARASTTRPARVRPAATWRARRSASASRNSALWATATTAASNGSVNSMHDSFTPLGGLVPMWLMQLGEVIFGGVGSGLYGMLVFAIVAVFVAGLMVGRTPEYLGKKIEAYEMKMASLVILIPPVARAGRHRHRRGRSGRQGRASRTRARTASARSSTPSPRPATTTAAPSPASAPTRPSTTRPLGLAMLFARYWLAVPALAIAGSLAAKKIVPPSLGHAARRTRRSSSRCWSAS